MVPFALEAPWSVVVAAIQYLLLIGLPVGPTEFKDLMPVIPLAVTVHPALVPALKSGRSQSTPPPQTAQEAALTEASKEAEKRVLLRILFIAFAPEAQPSFPSSPPVSSGRYWCSAAAPGHPNRA